MIIPTSENVLGKRAEILIKKSKLVVSQLQIRSGRSENSSVFEGGPRLVILLP